MHRGIGTLAILALLLAGLLPIPVAADAEPPTISDWGWDPKYPIDPMEVRLFAHVTDADGLDYVEATWCFLPPFLCLWRNMTAMGGGLYEATAPTHRDARGSYMLISAQDLVGNKAETEKRYSLFVSAMDVTVEPDVLEAEPGQVAAVAGTVIYEGNASAPAEGVSVTVTVGGAPTVGATDASGRFSVDVTAPTNEGTYPVAVRATDRTIFGQSEATLAVSSVPRADLRVMDLLPSSENPVAGEPLSVTFRVRNVGSATALNAQVIAEVIASGKTRRVLDTRTDVPPSGGNVFLVATWTPAAGVQTLRITVDPGDEVDELNETNNVSEIAITVRSGNSAEALPLPWIGAGVGGVAAVALGLLMLRRRRMREPLEASSTEGKAN